MKAGGKRVKTGCITCRIRRVKCDEAKPSCFRCKSTGRSCDGYSDLPFSRRDLHAASQGSSSFLIDTGVGPLARLVTDPAFNDVLDKRYFQFFRLQTVVSTNCLVAAHFWDRTILQACHTVPAVRHAVLASSSWHQWSNLKARTEHRAYADRQYQLALKHAQQLVATADSEDIDKVLAACIVFICFEGDRGNHKASQLHMDNGRAIARQYASHFKNTSRRKDLVEIHDALARLDIPALTYSDVHSPYRYTLDDFLDTDPSLIPWDFKDIYEARTSLVDMSRWMMIIGHYVDFVDADLETRYQANKATCYARLRQWYCGFEKVVETADPTTELLVLCLRQFYHTCQAISIGAVQGPRTVWDEALSHLAKIVEYSEAIVQRLDTADGEISFSYDIGYTIGAFLAATVCRDPDLRRRAIKVLRVVPRQEGRWASRPASAIAQRWMEIEEDGLTDVKSAADIPDARRVRFIDTHVDVLSETAEVAYMLPSPNGEAYVPRRERLIWTNATGGLHRAECYRYEEGY